MGVFGKWRRARSTPVTEEEARERLGQSRRAYYDAREIYDLQRKRHTRAEYMLSHVVAYANWETKRINKEAEVLAFAGSTPLAHARRRYANVLIQLAEEEQRELRQRAENVKRSGEELHRCKQTVDKAEEEFLLIVGAWDPYAPEPFPPVDPARRDSKEAFELRALVAKNSETWRSLLEAVDKAAKAHDLKDRYFGRHFNERKPELERLHEEVLTVAAARDFQAASEKVDELDAIRAPLVKELHETWEREQALMTLEGESRREEEVGREYNARLAEILGLPPARQFYAPVEAHHPVSCASDPGAGVADAKPRA